VTRRLALVTAVLLVPVVALAAFATSALLDRPAKTVRTEIVVDAPRPVVWELLSDFARYDEWNPYITQARGQAAVGEQVHLRFAPGSGQPRQVDCEVVVVNGMRKLEWICRSYHLPGILDREHIFRLLPIGEARVRIVYEGRWEGVFVPFSDLSPRQRGYVAMARALKDRAELAARGSS
jgi:hypothetical protein